jgi:hypothetical protein
LGGLIAVLTLFLFGLVACQREAPIPVAAPQPGIQLAPSPTKTVRRIKNPRYRLFKTQNIFNLLLLDTRTGQLWQVQYTIDEKKCKRPGKAPFLRVDGDARMRAY